MNTNDHFIAYRVHVTGTVQGVGFRPYVYRIALQRGLRGCVENRTDGVWISLWCTEVEINDFVTTLQSEAPPTSLIRSVTIFRDGDRTIPAPGFTIEPSQSNRNTITGICPDIGVCEECLGDMKKHPLRISYPFVNCTNCGPRFSIITGIPWDRQYTSMSGFTMCPDCRSEYTNPLDRRFHAQPIACNICGPVFYTHGATPGKVPWHEILADTIQRLKQGHIGAIQGIGGYHLICDATNEHAVAELRNRKHRDAKPFAVLFAGIHEIRQHCQCSAAELRLLTSWQRPIVILNEKKMLNRLINNDLRTLGVMLPYTPLHHQLFEQGNFSALICTSANISDEPMVISPQSAGEKLKNIADFFIHSNRAIINRTDDSVIRMAGSNPILIRRSRGFVPSALPVSLSVEGILALGAEQKNTFCVGKENEAILSQHLGDVKGLESLKFMEESLERFKMMFRFTPTLVATDLHPDYISSQFGQSLGIRVIKVQHHHAHIASCMAEHQLDEPVIGVAFDGAGLGSDQTIWGGEFLLATLSDYKRFAWLDPIKLPGADMVAKEPWRAALAYLHQCYGDQIPIDSFPGLKRVQPERCHQVIQLLQSGIPLPLSSSAGRLFDAFSVLSGCCAVNRFEAEAAVRFELVADETEKSEYPFEFDQTVSFLPTIEALRHDLEKQISVPIISAKFHRTLARVVLTVCQAARKQSGLNKVILSGGTFQNAYLTQLSLRLLKSERFKPFIHQKVPPNDGGIALGQLLIAAKTKNDSICA